MLLISTSCMLPTSTFVPWLTWGAEQGMSSALRSSTHHTCSHGKPHQSFRASVLTMMKWGQNSPLTSKDCWIFRWENGCQIPLQATTSVHTELCQWGLSAFIHSTNIFQYLTICQVLCAPKGIAIKQNQTNTNTQPSWGSRSTRYRLLSWCTRTVPVADTTGVLCTLGSHYISQTGRSSENRLYIYPND